MADDLSGSAVDNLHAALNHDLADTNKDLPAEYLAACRRWYDALSSGELIVLGWWREEGS